MQSCILPSSKGDTTLNILWICTDQQRLDSLGCYGNPVIDTPNLNALGENGILFENCYAQSPVCSPSRAAFLTGRYPQVCDLYENGSAMNPQEVMVTKILADNGYTCGLAGKLHLSPCHPSACTSIEPRIDDGYSVFYWSHHPQKDWPLNDYHLWLEDKGEQFERRPYDNSPYIYEGMPEDCHHTTYCTDRAIGFIRAHSGFPNPWLFSLNYFDPHHDFDPPKALMDKYMGRLDQIPLPSYTEGELDNKPVFQQTDHRGAYGGQAAHAYPAMDERDHKMHTAAYYAMVELIDRQIGRLVQALKDSGQWEDTVILFHSDHGEMLGDHGIYLKGPYFYDCAVNVPLIISNPNLPTKGQRSRALVELVDLPETILDIAGIPVSSRMMGHSLWDICTGKQTLDTHKNYVYSEYYNAMNLHDNPRPLCTMIFDGRYKLTACHGSEPGELYDMQSDPGEVHNLWGDATYAQIQLEMYIKLSAKLAAMRDPAFKRVSEW